MFRKIYIYFLLIAAGFFCGFSSGGRLEKLQMEMTMRTAYKGKVTQTKAALHYFTSGKLIANFTTPKNYILVNNSKGELSIYFPETNSVKQLSNFQFSTESSLLYYFLKNQNQDLGLAKLGFILIDTKYEGKLMITNWQAPMQMLKLVSKVKLVTEDGRPIYVEYLNAKGKVNNKTYFYKYQNFDMVRFPAAITTITYGAVQGDSTISKTSFSDIKINAEANSKMFDFKIPADAKMEN